MFSHLHSKYDQIVDNPGNFYRVLAPPSLPRLGALIVSIPAVVLVRSSTYLTMQTTPLA